MCLSWPCLFSLEYVKLLTIVTDLLEICPRVFTGLSDNLWIVSLGCYELIGIIRLRYYGLRHSIARRQRYVDREAFVQCTAAKNFQMFFEALMTTLAINIYSHCGHLCWCWLRVVFSHIKNACKLIGIANCVYKTALLKAAPPDGVH